MCACRCDMWGVQYRHRIVIFEVLIHIFVDLVKCGVLTLFNKICNILNGWTFASHLSLSNPLMLHHQGILLKLQCWRRWHFRVCFQIPHAKQIEKTTLLGLLSNHIPGNFRPIQFQYQGDMAVFYVDDRDVADIIKGVSKTITLPDTNLKVSFCTYFVAVWPVNCSVFNL